ncbi:MAG: TfoX/Sxy family protein [Polyangiaceae bacterium]
MAYDEKTADRIRDAIGPRMDVSEKKMFGGLAFLLDGKMFVGLSKDDLMVRVGPVLYERALGEAHVRPMDFTGRPLTGYVFVAPAGYRTAKAMAKWVERSLTFVATVPKSPKKPAKKKPPIRSPRRRTSA